MTTNNSNNYNNNINFKKTNKDNSKEKLFQQTTNNEDYKHKYETVKEDNSKLKKK